MILTPFLSVHCQSFSRYKKDTFRRLTGKLVLYQGCNRDVQCKSEIGEAIGAVRWAMNTASLLLKELAHQQPRILYDVLVRFNKQPIFVFIKASRDALRDGIEVCSRQHIKFARLEDLASHSSNTSSVALVAAIDCISCEV